MSNLYFIYSWKYSVIWNILVLTWKNFDDLKIKLHILFYFHKGKNEVCVVIKFSECSKVEKNYEWLLSSTLLLPKIIEWLNLNIIEPLTMINVEDIQK